MKFQQSFYLHFSSHMLDQLAALHSLVLSLRNELILHQITELRTRLRYTVPLICETHSWWFVFFNYLT